MPTYADIAEKELDPRFSGTRTGGGFALQKRPIYKLNNKNPKSNEAVKPGITMKVGDASEVVTEVNAVILMHTRKRSVWGKDNHLVCASDDGLTPSATIKDPKCNKVSAKEIAETLSKFKGYDRAKIVDTTDKLTEGTQTLQTCGIAKRDGSLIPICPCARKDDMGRAAICKESVLLIAYDLDRKRVFNMTISGGSIRKDREVAAPFWKYLDRIASHSAPTYGVSVKLSSQEVNGFFVLNFSDEKPISKDERDAMKLMAVAELENYERRCSGEFRPKNQSLPDQPDQDRQQQQAAKTFKEDDINFSEE